jgi:hypothetical protein
MPGTEIGRLEELLEEIAVSLRGSSGRNEEISRILLRQSEKQASRLEIVMKQLDDLAEESRAHSQAIFILIDRLTLPSDE